MQISLTEMVELIRDTTASAKDKRDLAQHELTDVRRELLVQNGRTEQLRSRVEALDAEITEDNDIIESLRNVLRVKENQIKDLNDALDHHLKN